MKKKKLTKEYSDDLKDFLKEPPKNPRGKIKTGKVKRVKSRHR